MKVYKAYSFVTGDPSQEGETVLFHVIQHEGRFWLVAKWLTPLGEGERVPARIVDLAGLGGRRVEEADQGKVGFEFQIPGGVPRAVLEGLSRQGPSGELDVVDMPFGSLES